MPLQLVNHGVTPIVLTPYLHICQLTVTRTSAESERVYGTAELGSKYMNDEGEPSRYWQDVRIKRLQEACGRVHLPERIQTQFVKAVGRRETDLVDRFLAFLHTLPAGDITSAREVLERFADQDTRKMAWAKRKLQLMKWLPLVPITPSIGVFFKLPYEWPHFLLWGITAVFLPFGLWAMLFAPEPNQPFTRRDVADYFGGITDGG
jgi:hypothetical protein